MTKRVKVVENDELSALVPHKRASILHLILTDGTKRTYRVDYPKGEPENPLTDNEIEEKFMSLASAASLTKERCTDIINIIHQPSFKLIDLLEKLK